MATLINRSLFVFSPGKARASIPGHGARGTKHRGGRSSYHRGKTTQCNTRVRKAESKRYSNSSISNACASRAKRSETGRHSFATFESFKNRFSGYFTSAKSRRTTGSLPSKLEADYFRSRYFNDGCGVQAPVHIASTSNLSESVFDLFSARIG